MNTCGVGNIVTGKEMTIVSALSIYLFIYISLSDMKVLSISFQHWRKFPSDTNAKDGIKWSDPSLYKTAYMVKETEAFLAD